MASNGANDCDFLLIMIDSVSNFALVGIMAFLVAMEAFPASHKFVWRWCIPVTIVLWSCDFLVELMIGLGG